MGSNPERLTTAIGAGANTQVIPYDSNNKIENSNIPNNKNNKNNQHNQTNISTTEDVNELYYQFTKKEFSIETYLDIETPDDPAFNELKKQEKNVLLENLKLKDNFIKTFENAIKSKTIPLYNNKDLVSEFIETEKGEDAFQTKIEQCIEKIQKTKNDYQIKYLTVMLVGKSGVGKSTLINSVLQLEKGSKAKTGTGKFVTIKYTPYKNDSVPFLRLIDTRGIELNKNYGSEQVKEDAEEFIQKQKDTNDPNNFVQCIWYCFTGTRFEQAEVSLLNSLRSTYGESTIPIILIYTQATDRNAINEMKEYIKSINLDANFLEVLAERKELVNNSGAIEAFGIDKLIKETLKKCRNALKGEMFSVITEGISKKVENILNEQNQLDKDYIIKTMKLCFIDNFSYFTKKETFINFVMHLLGFNIIIFFEKKDKQLNINCSNIFDNSDLFNNYIYVLMKDYENIAEDLITPLLEKKSKELINLQVKVQKDFKKEISYENQRNLEDFQNSIKEFYCAYFYNLGQKMIIQKIFDSVFLKLTDEFIRQFNIIITELLRKDKNKDKIKECFLTKFNEFEIGLKSYKFLFTETKVDENITINENK